MRYGNNTTDLRQKNENGNALCVGKGTQTQKRRCSLISCRVAVGIAKVRKISATSAKADVYDLFVSCLPFRTSYIPRQIPNK